MPAASGEGEQITCTQGIPAGTTLTGSGGPDTIDITGTVDGTVDAGEGASQITIRGVDSKEPDAKGGSAIGATGRVIAPKATSVTATGGNAPDMAMILKEEQTQDETGTPVAAGAGNRGSIEAGDGTTVTVTGGLGCHAAGPSEVDCGGGTGNAGTITGSAATKVVATGGAGAEGGVEISGGTGGAGNTGTITAGEVEVTGGKGGDGLDGRDGTRGGYIVNKVFVINGSDATDGSSGGDGGPGHGYASGADGSETSTAGATPTASGPEPPRARTAPTAPMARPEQAVPVPATTTAKRSRPTTPTPP
ncbi:hypothetical protein DEJ50_00485 [Streptomyces venezuelae]|uniref:Uncharacterized protein n=1 Tax=Streptomyces venezuelae TaxID=54571 RepID=A0A5P2CUG7_STRVZ|nr:hypothetical protein [Streptomyces venezuelae]QES46556.1 hypothetical protein DEJ50_00485 [Streptomyces venezuelae]